MRRLLTPVVAGALVLAACGGDDDEPAATTATTEWPVTHMGEPLTVTVPEDSLAKPSVAEVVVENPHAFEGGTALDVSVDTSVTADNAFYPDAFVLETQVGETIPETDGFGLAAGDEAINPVVEPGHAATARVTFDVPLSETEGGAVTLLSHEDEPLATWRLG